MKKWLTDWWPSVVITVGVTTIGLIIKQHHGQFILPGHSCCGSQVCAEQHQP